MIAVYNLSLRSVVHISRRIATWNNVSKRSLAAVTL